MPNDTIVQSNNYTLLKIIRSSISPLSAMIGIIAYYGQVMNNSLLGSINSLLFGKKLGLDIWNLNQRPTTKSKLIKAFLPLCTILILSHKCWEKPIYGLLPTFLNQT
ncbi:hypothetical protein [Spiroplasma endosymbiont of Apeira syringaria]|uniref:hypothetical protein n=1 Tax=Spiroplasma endosymbiont of Apeira syringaria TaxID=3066307 RepID=UPI0030D5390E